MPEFRKKPVVIEAMQWGGSEDSARAIKEWAGSFEEGTSRVRGWAKDNVLLITTLEGEMTASPDDWIIRGVKGEFYPVKPDIFQETYEAVT